MKQRKSFYQEFVAKKTRRTRVIHRGFMFVIFAIVLHDSFVHNLPFYYILFALAGLLVERVYRASRRMDVDEDEGLIHERSGLAWIFVVAILALRLPFGDWALKKVHVVWFSDALYLFALGLHFARLRGISRQVDELVYGYVVRSKRGPDPPSQPPNPESGGHPD
jgi:hypothetical protein